MFNMSFLAQEILLFK